MQLFKDAYKRRRARMEEGLTTNYYYYYYYYYYYFLIGKKQYKSVYMKREHKVLKEYKRREQGNTGSHSPMPQPR